jgi:hypothetical protein
MRLEVEDGTIPLLLFLFNLESRVIKGVL